MLVFDLDDTLYLERDFAFSGFRQLGNWVERTYNTKGFEAACKIQFMSGNRQYIFNVASAELGLPVNSESIKALVQRYREHKPDITLCADASAFLQSYSGPMGLITDGPEQTQRNKIAALRLEQHIAHIRPTGAWPDGFGKPHPRAFVEMESLARNHQQMVYVADNPAKDFVTPNARGWTTIQILRPEAVHDPVPPSPEYAAQHQIHSLSQLSELIYT